MEDVHKKKVTRSVVRSSVKHDWETPPDLFDALNREFGFTVDVCADPKNAKCQRYFTIHDNGLAQPWAALPGGAVCWMNPPYGPDLPRWMQKAHMEASLGATVVCLVPARTHTKWFHRLCRKAEVRFLRGRLRYVDTAGEAPFAQLIIIFRPGLAHPWVMKFWEWKPRTTQQLLVFSSQLSA